MTERSESPRAVLLASAAYAGTLATVRELGANGIRVSVLSGPRLATGWSPRISAAAWSRYASRTVRSPPERENQRFLAKLLAIGAAEPGQVLLPTSDETAWLYTVNAGVLEPFFRLYQPTLLAIQRILDKQQFAAAATAAGVDCVPTWEVCSQEALEALAPTLPYPILIKPRTHVNRLRNDKGVRVDSPQELVQEYPRFIDREIDGLPLNPLLPEARVPILQQFVSVRGEGVCSISGFIDRTGELFVTRRSKKVLQRSQPAGVGICFESLPPDRGLSDAVRRLCRELGYFGIFEVEFLYTNGVWAVIDFNPRTFNQIGMDIPRGMSLPLLAWMDAAGENEALHAAVAAAQVAPPGSLATVFCDRFTLRALLLAKWLTRRISREDLAYWRSWMKRNSACCVDVAASADDPWPRVIHIVSEIFLGLRAFRRFLRFTPRAAKTPTRAAELPQG
jgi:D-aspartate ligase